MAKILARFIHQFCGEGCDSYNAIDLKDLPITDDVDAKRIFLDTIHAAIKKHIEAVHRRDLSYRLIECRFVWKDTGTGHNLLRMERPTLFTQIALARDRGWVDCIHFKYVFDEDDFDRDPDYWK
ncbi:hypothetical protein EV127DRAFT_484341 [Xylaria flabelliformis]|nr:hypothetical protein EV127DRAFT_484341 [Xylaria flabelliformis]